MSEKGKIYCEHCHVEIHHTERPAQIDGKFYHTYHKPKPVAMNIHSPRQRYLPFKYPGLVH